MLIKMIPKLLKKIIWKTLFFKLKLINKNLISSKSKMKNISEIKISNKFFSRVYLNINFSKLLLLSKNNLEMLIQWVHLLLIKTRLACILKFYYGIIALWERKQKILIMTALKMNINCYFQMPQKIFYWISINKIKIT